MIIIRTATSHDEPAIAQLLADYHMVPPDFSYPAFWWVATDAHSGVVATIGAERAAHAWLLRSAVVTTAYRGQGIGKKLTNTLLNHALEQSISKIYCFSTDAGAYWRSHRFYEVPVPQLLTDCAGCAQIDQFAQLGWLPTEVAWCYTH